MNYKHYCLYFIVRKISKFAILDKSNKMKEDPEVDNDFEDVDNMHQIQNR